MLTKRMPVHISSDDEPRLVKRTARPSANVKWVVAKISTTTVDMDGDVLVPGGVDLRDFRKNPLVFFGHQIDKFPVGTAVGMKPTPTDIVSKIVFEPRPRSLPAQKEWDPDSIHEMMQNGTLRGFSVGATILPGGARPSTPKDVSRFGEGVRRVVERWKLNELSIVPLPANPDALAMSVSKGIIAESSWLHEQLLSGPALDTPPARLLVSVQRPPKISLRLAP